MSANPFRNLSRTDILEALAGLGSTNLQANLNFLTSRNIVASESPAVQAYGQATPSRNWNNVEPATPAHTSFSGLNLNSVDEEDEFLYGDSNSVPETQTPVQNDSVVINTERIDTGWSDEDDPFGEVQDTTSLNKLNSRLKKNLTDYDSQNQNKIQESIKNFPIKIEKDLIPVTTPVEEVREQRYVSQKKSESHLSALSQLEKDFPETSSASARDKSKYHIAAELLKKRTAEKQSAVNSNSSEKSIIPGTSKSVSGIEKALHAGLKTQTDKKPEKPRVLNKKHVDNINDYLTKQQRKRPHLPEEYPQEKHPRYERSHSPSRLERSRSPARYERSHSPSRHERNHSPSRRHSPSRHLSPHRTSFQSYKYKAFDRDNIKYDTPYHRSPSFESEKYHSSSWYKEDRRRYSPSPNRWSGSHSPDYRHSRSHEKSSDYSKYKDRSPRSRRSRSRSPGYYSSRSKTHVKKRSKSPKKSDHYSKKKDKLDYSSGDSFCSLSFGTSSDSSSNSSDESSDEKRNSKKIPKKKVPKDNRKLADEKADLKDASKLSDSAAIDDISNLSDILKNEPSLLKSMYDAMQPNNEQLLISLLEQHQQQQQLLQQQQQPVMVSSSLTFTSPSVSNVSNMQMPSIPSSESYAYPTVPSAPVQYMPPQMTNFPQMTPAATFPAPVMSTPPAPVMPMPPAPVMTTPLVEYGPYLPIPAAPSNDSQYDTNLASKSANIRPSVSLPRRELRTIPVLDKLPASSTAYSGTNNIPIIPSNTPLQKLATDTKKTQEAKLSAPASKQLPEKTTGKEAEKNISSPSRSTRESTSGRNKDMSEQKKNNTTEQNKRLIIEKFKKMKAERARALNKAKSASEDLDEMRKMLDSTFGKKISSSEKVLYSKCKVQFNYALDMASQKNKEASRSDENLNHFKSKLPTSVLEEVNKIKLEECLEKPVIKEKYSCLDQGDHTCSDCYLGFNNIKEMLDHIRTPEHKKRMESANQDWKRHFIREEKEDGSEHKKTILKAVKGVEFIKPLTGFYCSLCREILLEESSVETHLKGHKHFENYDNFNIEAPLYERKRLFKRFIHMAIWNKIHKKPIVDNTEAIEAEQKKKEEQKKKMKEAAADKKSKEILLKEKSSETKVVELDDEDSEDLHPSSNQKTANIKLNLSDRDKSANSSKELEAKNPAKFIFIGKAPNFKKPLSQKSGSEKSTPWYKRVDILNKKESDVDTSSNAMKKSPSPDIAFKSSSKNVKEPPNSTKGVENTSSSKSSLQNVQESLNSVKILQNSKSSLQNIKKLSNSEKTQSSNSLHPNDKPRVVENKKLDNKQVDKSKSASFTPNVNLSNITLPESSSLPSSSKANIPQPMHIDNSQDVPNKPKSEEEKDFLLLGINREDFQPLVVPVPPPPTSMISYPNMPNTQTMSSNINCSTSSTSNSVQQDMIKSLVSVPPPNISPYQNNAQLYGNQNNPQNIMPYTYPSNNQQLPAYSNLNQMNMQTNYQTMPSFSTPPPAFRNPPPSHPYSNMGNIPPASQYSCMNNMPYNTYPNSRPANPSYGPTMYPVPHNTQSQYPIPNVSQNLVPPGSEYDSSLRNNSAVTTNAPTQVSQNKTVPTQVSQNKIVPTQVSQNKNVPTQVSQNKSVPTQVSQNKSMLTQIPQSKISPTLKKVGNLIAIIPDRNSKKPVESGKVTSKINVQDNSKNVTSKTLAADNVDKSKNNTKNKIEKSGVALRFNKETLNTSKIVGKAEESSPATSNSNEKIKKQVNDLMGVKVKCIEGQVKRIVDDIVKEIGFDEQGVTTKDGKVTVDKKDNEVNVTIKTAEKIIKDNIDNADTTLKESTENKTASSVFSSSEIGEDEKDNKDIVTVKADKKMIENNVHDIVTTCSISEVSSSNKVHENAKDVEMVNENINNKNDTEKKAEVTTAVAVGEKITDNMQNSEVTLEQSTEKIKYDSLVLKDEQIIEKNAIEFSPNETSKSNLEEDLDKQTDAKDNNVSEKPVESCSLAENLVNEKEENIKMTNVNTVIEEKSLTDSCNDKNTENEITKSDAENTLVPIPVSNIVVHEMPDYKVENKSIGDYEMDDLKLELLSMIPPEEFGEDTALEGPSNNIYSIAYKTDNLSEYKENPDDIMTVSKDKIVDISTDDGEDTPEKNAEKSDSALETSFYEIFKVNHEKVGDKLVGESGNTASEISKECCFSAEDSSINKNSEDREMSDIFLVVEDEEDTENLCKVQNEKGVKSLKATFPDGAGESGVSKEKEGPLLSTEILSVLTDDVAGTNSELNEKHGDIEMSDIATMVENEVICNDKKLRNEENTKSHVTSSVTTGGNDVLGENKISLPNIEVLPISNEDTLDSNKKESDDINGKCEDIEMPDISTRVEIKNMDDSCSGIKVQNQNQNSSEIDNLNLEGEISGQDLKCDINSQLASSNVKKQRGRKGRKSLMIRNKENAKSHVTSSVMTDGNDVLGENKISFPNIEVLPISNEDTLDSNKKESDDINEKCEDVEMPDISARVENKNMDDSCSDIKVQNENSKNQIAMSFDADGNDISKENKKSSPSTEILSMSVDAVVDSDKKDSSEIDNLNLEEEISSQDLKCDINSQLSSNVKKQRARKGRKSRGKRVVKTRVGLITSEDSKEPPSLSSNPVADENKAMSVEEEKFENISSHGDISEDSGPPILEKVSQDIDDKSEDKVYNTRLKLDEKSEESKNSEDEAKASLASGSQDSESLKSKTKASTLSAAEKKEDADDTVSKVQPRRSSRIRGIQKPKSSKKSKTALKESSDTEEYEDDDEEDKHENK